jgi:site-specific DNA recombinase
VYKELVEDDLRVAGVSVLYINRPLGDTPEDRLLGGMQGLLAEYERAKILDRTRRGMRYKIDTLGLIWRSRRNYGYRYIPKAQRADYEKLVALGQEPPHKDGWVIVESEAAVVRLIFSWILAGKSAIWVADELNHRGIPALRGGRWWDTTVGGIIRNPIYSGNATFDRYVACEPTRSKKSYPKRRKSSHRQRPESEWTLLSVPAIITPEEHAAAKAALARNKSRSKRNTKEFYLLAGLLRCGYENHQTGQTCGMTLGCHVQRGVRPEIAREHRCTRAYVSDGHKRTRCQNRIRAHEIEPLVWEYLVTRLQRQDILDE